MGQTPIQPMVEIPPAGPTPKEIVIRKKLGQDVDALTALVKRKTAPFATPDQIAKQIRVVEDTRKELEKELKGPK